MNQIGNRLNLHQSNIQTAQSLVDKRAAEDSQKEAIKAMGMMYGIKLHDGMSLDEMMRAFIKAGGTQLGIRRNNETTE